MATLVPASGTGATPPDTVAPTTPAPPPTTAAPAPDPATDDGTDDDGIDWWPIVVALALGVALVALVSAMGDRRRDRPVAPRPGTRPRTDPARAPSAEVQLLTTAQWIHDQLTLELLVAPAATAAARWGVERSRIDNVAIGARQLWVSGAGDTWQSLAQMLSLLATTLDANIAIRMRVPVDQPAIDESTVVVNRQRATLDQLLAAMWPLARR